MKPLIRYMIIVTILLSPVISMAQQGYQIKSHEVKIDGTSNLQSWWAEAEDISGQFDVHIEDGKIVAIDNVNIRITAESIKGSGGRRMNKKIYEALDTDNHSDITYELREILSLNENPGTARITARGVLTVAGVSRNIEMNPVGQVLNNGDIEFTGTQIIDMTNYNVDPPTAMFGLLQTGEEIEISYKIVASER